MYVVQRRDNLTKIARAWLGDPDRWPEICRLNKHRHFPTVGGRLRDCDLIYPGWDLRLPDDASPPAGAVPLPRRPYSPEPPADPDGVIEQPPTTPPADNPPAAQSPDVSDAPPSTATEHGVELPGGFVP